MGAAKPIRVLASSEVTPVGLVELADEVVHGSELGCRELRFPAGVIVVLETTSPVPVTPSPVDTSEIPTILTKLVQGSSASPIGTVVAVAVAGSEIALTVLAS